MQEAIGGDEPVAEIISARRRRRSGGGLMGIVIAAYCLALAGSVLLILSGAGLLGPWSNPGLTLRAVGYVGVLLTLTLCPMAIIVMTRAGRGGAGGMLERLDRIERALHDLHQHASLSDDARRVLNRRTERDLLCRAIEEDIQAGEWDAGIVLCGELADRFGYRADAEEYRSRIEHARAEMVHRHVNDAISRLDGLIVQRRWDEAFLEAARIRRLFPESPRTENLRKRVEQARAVYKMDLERRFLQAAEQEHLDEAMELLKEMDGYLTEAEAEPFREVARGVIGKARENLGVQFKVAVHDRQWATAAAVGRRIVREFPNTRMAQEVRGMLDGILTRANAAGSPG